MSDKPVLDASRIRSGYGAHAVLHDVSVRVDAGSIVSLVGPNGSGKSTLLKTLSGFVPLQQGHVALWGQSLDHLSARQIARRLAFVAQDAHVPGGATVEELVSQGRFPHRQSFFDMFGARDRQVVELALHQTTLLEFRYRLVVSLSGGERQRVWLAMALAQEPSLLFLDEPTTYLDIAYQLELLEGISRLNLEQGLTVVMALHDLNLAARFSQRMIVLSEGRVAADGPPQQVLTADLFEQVFGVRVAFAEAAKVSVPIVYPLHTERRQTV